MNRTLSKADVDKIIRVSVPGGSVKTGLYLRITKKKDGTYNISGSPQSLDALGSMLTMKAKNPESFFGTMKGHGSEVSITIPGIECPDWLKP